MAMPSEKDIENALEREDVSALKGFVEAGLSPDWKDDAGNTLLHHAARFGDAGLINALLLKGAKPFALNDDLETPRDVAIIWGKTSAAAQIAAPLALNREGATEKIAYSSLQEIRDISAQEGINHLYVLAKSGRFAQVAALAEKDARGLTAADLLAKGPNGDSVVLAIAQRGDLKEIMKPALWSSKPEEFHAVWQSVPAQYRKGLDYEAFIGVLRQDRIKSYGKPKLPGLKS